MKFKLLSEYLVRGGYLKMVNKTEMILISETFRSSAEAGPSDILKLYNKQGNLINISPRLPANSPDTRYKLEVVAVNYSKCLLKFLLEVDLFKK